MYVIHIASCSPMNCLNSHVMNLKKIFIAAHLCVLFLFSCTTPKNVTLLQDLSDGDVSEAISVKDIRIKPEDKLSIVVNSKDPMLADLFNLPVISHRVGTGTSALSTMSNSQYVSYYTVNSKGDIDFPVLGEIHIAGMNREELAAYIKGRLVKENLVKDPVVTVEYTNTGISVLGEVTRPGRYDINRDRLTLLEALGMAGDLTIQGVRENVLVLRDENGRQVAYRIDLTDAKSLQNSPAYYLQQNDVVYVEPNAVKKRQTTVNGNNVLSASFWVSVASLLTSIAVLVFK